jgi:hypothetical protein
VTALVTSRRFLAGTVTAAAAASLPSVARGGGMDGALSSGERAAAEVLGDL